MFSYRLHIYCIVLPHFRQTLRMQKTCKLRAVLFCTFSVHFGMQFCLDFWPASVRTCCLCGWEFVCMCMLHALVIAAFLTNTNMQKACNMRAVVVCPFCAFWHAVLFRLFCKRHAKCVLHCCVPSASSFACGSARMCLHALVRTRCRSFWDVVCMYFACVGYACLLILHACTRHAHCVLYCSVGCCIHVYFACITLCAGLFSAFVYPDHG